ncbi:MAG: cytochrome P450 [Mycobacterium sp.]
MTVLTQTNGQAPPEVPLTDIDLGSSAFWVLDDDLRDGAFVTLRRQAPITFFPELTRPGQVPGAGHWALTKHEDVQYASRHPEIFSSVPSITMTDPNPELAKYFESMLMMDDPRHRRLRSIVSRAFTPKVLTRIEESIKERARRLVSDLVAAHPDGCGELVTEVAAPLPLQVICDMMGIPEADHDRIFAWTNAIANVDDPEQPNGFQGYARAATEMGMYSQALADDRRRRPRGDLTTGLVQAEANGQKLTAQEIGAFFILLVFAGAETTRTAISHGLVALTRFPEQRRLWWADFDRIRPTAVEEILRWASPVTYMRRTLKEDIVLRGTRMAAGEKVTMWYQSANRDEATFTDPWTFDLRRDPNPHVSFGAGGIHYCLGANLARREIGATFDELRRQAPDIAASAAPTRQVSPFINGIRRLPVSWTV